MDKITALNNPCRMCKRKAKAMTNHCHSICPDYKIYEAQRRQYRKDMYEINSNEAYAMYTEAKRIAHTKHLRKKMNDRRYHR